MDLYEANTHPFIVKIWLEETFEETGQVIWRGYIIHVPSGNRKHFNDLNDIPRFINSYLITAGIHLEKPPKIKGWLARVLTIFGSKSNR